MKKKVKKFERGRDGKFRERGKKKIWDHLCLKTIVLWYWWFKKFKNIRNKKLEKVWEVSMFNMKYLFFYLPIYLSIYVSVSSTVPAYNLVILSYFQFFKYILPSFSMLCWTVSHDSICWHSVSICLLPSPDCMLLVSEDGVRLILPPCRARIPSLQVWNH